VVLGVNTGFGGSAGSRTTDFSALQNALMQLTQSALVSHDDDKGIHDLELRSVPVTWVRAAMLTRVNALIRGHSGIPPEIIEAIVALIEKDLTPLIPLRGSISASGDLMPLAYIAGAIQGSPDIWVRAGRDYGYKIISAQEAVKICNIPPIVLGPKAGLALINGTAASAAIAGLAMFDAHQLAIMSHALVAMATEAMCGNGDNSHPFVAAVRPHPGQTEAAKTIRAFHKGTRLVKLERTEEDHYKSGLVQDRYSLRSATQWLGPQVEDLMLAHQQVAVELNSTTDNPVIDTTNGQIRYGCNFQAVSITSAMEKTRLSLQMIGKLLFAQTSELINPDLSNGLPPNLSADDPSLSFTMKGVDINMAAYMSELAFLAAPVSAHVQSAEMHNQGVNSLAFITARYTTKAVELVSLMSVTMLYVCCQALDLRVMYLSFLEEVQPILASNTVDAFGNLMAEDKLEILQERLWKQVSSRWLETAPLDLGERCTEVMASCVSIVVKSLHGGFPLSSSEPKSSDMASINTIEIWQARTIADMQATFESVRCQFFKAQPTSERLGIAAKQLYEFVRQDLGVPFHQGLVEHPTPDSAPSIDGRPKKTIGSWIQMIHESLRDGRLHGKLMKLLRLNVEAESHMTNGTV
jgi:phenylalanine ammonia-lyase